LRAHKAPVSPGADVGQSRRRRGSVPAQTWVSPGADVGQSRRRRGRVPAQMSASPGADVGPKHGISGRRSVECVRALGGGGRKQTGRRPSAVVQGAGLGTLEYSRR
jgi:hypothetical protein